MPTSRCSQYRLRRRVHFYEVDSAGIVHFSWYFRYMEEAEHALWREAGLSIAPSGAEIGFPRVAAAFDYRQVLRFEEEFEVAIAITAIEPKTMSYACRITRGATPIATGTLRIACVNKLARPWKMIAIPSDIAARFEVAEA
ncbi:MAG: acyl-CoA thioesterase [Acidobacteria bacterium]|nr:acyl-CoA thioesterase [Acidobacteriota bacterium]